MPRLERSSFLVVAFPILSPCTAQLINLATGGVTHLPTITAGMQCPPFPPRECLVGPSKLHVCTRRCSHGSLFPSLERCGALQRRLPRSGALASAQVSGATKCWHPKAHILPGMG